MNVRKRGKSQSTVAISSSLSYISLVPRLLHREEPGYEAKLHGLVCGMKRNCSATCHAPDIQPPCQGCTACHNFTRPLLILVPQVTRARLTVWLSNDSCTHWLWWRWGLGYSHGWNWGRGRSHSFRWRGRWGDIGHGGWGCNGEREKRR